MRKVSQRKHDWFSAVWNPTLGCRPVSTGCEHCVGAVEAQRAHNTTIHRIANQGFPPTLKQRLILAAAGRALELDERGAARARWSGCVSPHPTTLADPLSWRKPQRVLVSSMGDLFAPGFDPEYVAGVFAVMSLAEQHTFLLVTKYPEAAAAFTLPSREAAIASATALDYLDDRYIDTWGQRRPATAWPPQNLYVGVSAGTQSELERVLPVLHTIDAPLRFLVLEPLLEPIDLSGCLDGIGWVVTGGERARARARLCALNWLRNIARQCDAASVPCFVASLGSNSMLSPCDRCAGTNVATVDYETNETATPCPTCCGAPTVPLYWPSTVKGGNRDPRVWPTDLAAARRYPGEDYAQER